MKRQLLTWLAAGICCSAAAQNAGHFDVHLNGLPRCAFEDVLQKGHISYPDLARAYQAQAPAARGSGVVYDVPVVFHILYPSTHPEWNIPDSVVANQIAVLNKAYRKQNADTSFIRTPFKSLAGDAQIQFHLATTDPQGQPTNGITRTLTTRLYFGASDASLDTMEQMKHTATGGTDAWPGAHYLNIWVGNLSDSAGQLSVLGFGTPPINPLPSTWPAGTETLIGSMVDGVVLQVHTVGSNSSLNAALQGIYTKGRAAVHEVGHYLGLQHIFGSNGGGPAQCGALADDGIADTPEQSTNSFDNNSGTTCPPSNKNSCGSGTAGDLPDMWEDYMDYARDACQVMFTNGQIALMRSVLASQRSALTGTPNAIAGVTARPSLMIYPNPAATQIAVAVNGPVSEITMLNFLGQKVLELNGAAAAAKVYDVSTLPAGNYLLMVGYAGRQYTGRFSISR